MDLITPTATPATGSPALVKSKTGITARTSRFLGFLGGGGGQGGGLGLRVQEGFLNQWFCKGFECGVCYVA